MVCILGFLDINYDMIIWHIPKAVNNTWPGSHLDLEIILIPFCQLTLPSAARGIKKLCLTDYDMIGKYVSW